MDIRTRRNVTNQILAADTPAKVWELVAALLDNPNGYTDTTVLENARAWAAVATEAVR